MTSPHALEFGEEEIWNGRPVPRRMFGAADIFLIPLSVLFAMGTLLLVNAKGSSANPAMVAGFAVFSAYLLIGRFAVKYLVKKATTYELTNHRAIVIRRGKVVSEQRGEDMKVQLSESLSQKYATASFRENPVETVLGMSMIGKEGWLAENSGLDFLRVVTGGTGSVRFFDLPAGEAKQLSTLASSAKRTDPA
jgi:hypothetical protein